VIRVTIYSRPGCHLCDAMKALVTRVGQSMPFSLEEIDISHDASLEGLHGLEVPVLMIDGRKVAKYRVGEDELRRMLESRSGGPGRSG
jgi:glutaredoxin